MIKKSKTGKKSTKKIILFSSILILVLLVSLLGIGCYLSQPPVQTVKRAAFTIAQREPFSSIIYRLEQEGFLRSSFFFHLIVKLTQKELNFSAGTFELPQGKNAFQMVNILDKMQPLQHRVTIPEGLTSTQIARILEKHKVVTAVEFLKATRSPQLLAKWNITQDRLEGYLFPDTYFFSINTSAKSVVEKMVSTFFYKIQGLQKDKDPKKLHQTVILASIVEEEYRIKSEAPLIASVFLNRLKKKIRLDSCATIVYILTEEKKLPHPQRIRFTHTQIPSPYNTYLHYGLPPGPISNPGLVALQAVLQPVPSNYLYFVIDDPQKGSHQFSVSPESHRQARSKYLRQFSPKN